MKSEGGDSLETGELPELADMELDEFKDALREKDVGQIDLEELVREERKGKNRQKFLDFMVRHARELEVKNSLESLLASISEVDESLENIVEKDKERRLGADPEEITEKTVKELRNYLKEHYLTADQLEKILEAEKEGKDRKTAKKFVKREIRNTESPDDTQKILKNLEYTEDSIRKFKKDFIQNPGHFNLKMFDNPLEDVLNENIEDSKESRESENLSELLGLTENVIEVLEDVDNFRDREIIEELANKALLALEAEKYDTFREKIERIQEIGFEERKSSSKLDEVEEAINRLEGNFNEEKGGAENRSQRKTELMEILETKGFERSELRKKSTADLEELLESSKNIETLESAFKQAEEENHEEEGENDGENDEESSEEDESEPGENLDAELRGLEKSLKSTDL